MQPFLHQLKTIQKNDDIDFKIDKKRLYEKLEKTSIIGLFTLIVKYLKLNIPYVISKPTDDELLLEFRVDCDDDNIQKNKNIES